MYIELAITAMGIGWLATYFALNKTIIIQDKTRPVCWQDRLKKLEQERRGE